MKWCLYIIFVAFMVWFFTFSISCRESNSSTSETWGLGNRYKNIEDWGKNCIGILWRFVSEEFYIRNVTMSFNSLLTFFYYWPFFWSSWKGFVESTVVRMLLLKFLDLSIWMTHWKMSLLTKSLSLGKKFQSQIHSKYLVISYIKRCCFCDLSCYKNCKNYRNK